VWLGLCLPVAAAEKPLVIDIWPGKTVEDNAATIGEEKAAALLGPLRSQLRAQLNRDGAAIGHLTPAEIYDHKGA